MTQKRRLEVITGLRDKINNGQWLQQLPPVTTLATQFGCSRDVIDRALRDLCAEGILTRRGRQYYLDDINPDPTTVAAHRTHLIHELYRTGLTQTAYLQLAPTDQQTLTGRPGIPGYRRLQLAVDTFASPAADIVRAILGHHNTTRSLPTITTRRDAYHAANKTPIYTIKRWERRGAEELAAYLTSLTTLFDQGRLTDHDPDVTMTVPDIHQTLADLETRIRLLEV